MQGRSVVCCVQKVVVLVTEMRRRWWWWWSGLQRKVEDRHLRLDRHQERPGLGGNIELQHVAVFTDVVVEERRPDIAGLDGEAGQTRKTWCGWELV